MTYPVDPLVEFVHRGASPERMFNVSGTTWQQWKRRGLSEWEADRAATRLGVHPDLVWPGWTFDGMSVIERDLDNWWRPAWLAAHGLAS